MSKHDFDRLFDRLDALTVGFGPMFRDFQFETAGYPPHNIVRHSDNLFILELAVAGFKKHQLSIELLDNVLTVKGTKENFSEDPADTYQHRGIGNRAFEKKFKLAEFIEVVDVQLADGLLSITVMRNEPESAKPKVFEIK
jgi:molecular chaperone IbpA